MKKLLFVIPLMFLFAIPAYAIGGNGNQGNGQQVVVSPTGTAVKNQNQINNQGEGSQLQINNQEELNLGESQGEGLQIRNQMAVQNMSMVAEKVQEMLQVRTSGGIGDQIRGIAQEQGNSQQKIQGDLEKIEARSGFLKAILGPDYVSINRVRKEMEQNQLRIEKLEELQNQLVNQSDISAVQETIEALTEQNTSLQEMLDVEESESSLLGWLVKLFAR